MENTRRELVKWFADKRSYPLKLTYQLDMQGQTIRIIVDLPY